MKSTRSHKLATLVASSIPEFLTVAEYADVTRVSEATVRRRLADGTLPYKQVGGKRTCIRIPSSAVLSSPQRAEDANVSTISEDHPEPSRRRPSWQRHS